MSGPGDDRARVVITGLGVVSHAGSTVDAFWEQISVGPDVPVPEGEVPVDVSAWLRPRDARRSSRATRYAVAAAASAWAAAGFDEHDPWRTGVSIGNVYGAPDLAEAARVALAEGGPSAVGLHLAAQACENAPSAAVAGLIKAHGPVTAPATACAAGGHAIGEGIDQIRLGRCDVVLAGAAQGPMDDALVASYHAMRIVSSDGMVRPFDRRRDGARFSEGAGVLVLESLDHARRRGAPILAEALGHANTNDASNQLAGTPEPMARCLTNALADAGLSAGQVAAVIGHGTATIANDRAESAVVAQALGTAAPLTSVKRILGHGVATAGAWNAIAAVLALEHRSLPPAGLRVEVDPQVGALGLHVISGQPRPWSPGPVLTNAFGLGGTNSVLVFGPPPA